jgi:hypothetical protein
MDEIIPLHRISNSLGMELRIEQFGLKDIASVIEFDPRTVHSASLRIWDRIVNHSDLGVDPFQIAAYVDAQDPWVFEKITEIVGEPSIRSFYYLRAWVTDDTLDYSQVVQFAAADVFPKDLLLIDLLISNPYKPISKPEKKFFQQDYEGFGLLQEVFDNAKECAKTMVCEAITLVAASDTIVPVFEKYGFVVDDSPTGQSYKEFRSGAPMHLNV